MSDFEEKYRDALKKCAIRYSDMIIQYADECSYWGYKSIEESIELERLNKFLHELHVGCDNLPLMKLNRWLGYIQGVLIQLKLTTVEVERDWTRPLFAPLDFGEENGS